MPTRDTAIGADMRVLKGPGVRRLIGKSFKCRAKRFFGPGRGRRPVILAAVDNAAPANSTAGDDATGYGDLAVVLTSGVTYGDVYMNKTDPNTAAGSVWDQLVDVSDKA